MLFFTADPHFGHTNIIRYCARPFDDCAAMDAALSANWNARVGPEDDIYILGDFSLAHLSQVRGYLQGLNGHKHLIVGNHDKFLNEAPGRKVPELCEICDYKELHSPSGYTYILMHYPLMFWNGSIDPQVIHLYGHIHNNTYCNEMTGRLRNALNVGADLHHFAPLSESEILAQVAAHNAALSSSINGDAPKDGPLKTHGTTA
ncbi:MAG: hypothetical protein IAA31_07995 [Candidatus Anaerobiospirillum merdipullorum]|uniref:Phosphoesterase or phosphohydrolase n=1 Tax=Candidatus Anaerobiospirillum merdipullorum TaxID=2838450 RepID=A0A9E2KQ31_9GAMM|nr:hypothetical protein [Candidatus Anaerobiospirillum merdipullorum]